MYVQSIERQRLATITNSAGHLVPPEKPPALMMTSGSPQGHFISLLSNVVEALSLHHAISMETSCNPRLLERLAPLQWVLALSYWMKMEPLM